MRQIIASTYTHKVVKQVEEPEAENLMYSAVATLWLPETLSIPKIRMIYNNQFINDRGPNFTVWALNSQTGIWGCFADQHDLGFDMFEEYTLVRQNKTLSPEQVEDVICTSFFAQAVEHTNCVYGIKILLEPDMPTTFQLNDACRETLGRLWELKVSNTFNPAT